MNLGSASDGQPYLILTQTKQNGQPYLIFGNFCLLYFSTLLINFYKFLGIFTEKVVQKTKKVESSLNRTQIKTIQGYLSDTVTSKRSERLQKCVDHQNRTEMTQNTMSFKNQPSKMSSQSPEAKGRSLSGHQSDIEGLKKALSALSKSACNIDSRSSNQKSLSDTELTPPIFQQMNQTVRSAEVSTTYSTTPRLMPRIPTSVSPEMIRSPNTTSPLQMATGPLPRMSLGSRMARLQNIVGMKPKNLSVSDTETTFGANRNVLTDNKETSAEVMKGKSHLSDGDSITGLSRFLQHARASLPPDREQAKQNPSPAFSKDGNMSDSSTATSGSQNLLNLRGLIPNANPNITSMQQTTLLGGKRLSDSSDTEIINPALITQR